VKVAGYSLWFASEITDARRRFGNLDYKVKPVTGDGEAWHQADGMKVREQVTVG